MMKTDFTQSDRKETAEIEFQERTTSPHNYFDVKGNVTLTATLPKGYEDYATFINGRNTVTVLVSE